MRRKVNLNSALNFEPMSKLLTLFKLRNTYVLIRAVPVAVMPARSQLCFKLYKC